MATRVRLIGFVASFLLLNAAAWWGFWVWLSGRTTATWQKIAYVELEDNVSEAA
jgi:hypothetical protein